MSERAGYEVGAAGWLRRLPHYLYVAELYAGRRVLEVGCDDGRGAHFLADRGAAHVVAVDSSAERVVAARARYRLSNLEYRREDPAAIELEDAAFDCVFVPDGAAVLRRGAVLAELRRVLAPAGHLVLAAASADRPALAVLDRPAAVSYHELHERLAPLFAPVRLVAQSALAAATLVEYADDDDEPEIELDTTLVELSRADVEVDAYVAVCGGAADRPARGYTIVQVPPAWSAPAAPARAEPDEAAERGLDALRAELDQALRERMRAESDAERLRWQLEDAAESQGGAAQEPSLTELLSEAMTGHAERVAALEEALEESQAYVDELRDELERARAESAEAAERRRAAEARVAEAEAEVAGWRTRAALAEGEALRLTSARADASADAPAVSGRVAELERELEATRRQLERTTDNWRQAEAKSDEVWRKVGELSTELEQHREEAVVRAAAQRQASQLAVTRAMEESSKKLVSVKDDLVRTERERARLEIELGAVSARCAELEEALARAGDGPREGNGGATAPADLWAVREALAALERDVAGERALLRELEEGLGQLVAARRPPEGYGGEASAAALSFELGLKDAELTLMSVGLSSLQARLRGVIADLEGQRAHATDDDTAALIARLAAMLTPLAGS
jgi:SAM-dependent methyltransferase/predicted  nucleic acid-binding Zn-ribbon protein